MSLYADKIVPHLVHWSMRQQMLEPYRRRLVREAIGIVLEIGVGSGLNLPLYRTETTHVIGLDPSRRARSVSDPWYDDLIECSPCYRERSACRGERPHA